MIKRFKFLLIILPLLTSMILGGCGGSGGALAVANQSNSTVTALPPGPPPAPQFVSSAKAIKTAPAFTLSQGWNTVSFPYDNVTATSGFPTVLYWFDGSGYQSIDPNLHPELLDCHRGFWAYADSPAGISATGAWSGSDYKVNLVPGWNFVGFRKQSSLLFSEARLIYNNSSASLAAGTGSDSGNPQAWAYDWIYEFRNGDWITLSADTGTNQFEPWHGYWLWAWKDGLQIDFHGDYQNTLEPNIDALTPGSGKAGDPVTIKGLNFGNSQLNSLVALNGMNCGTAASWSDRQILVSVPAGAGSGLLSVTVNSKTCYSPATFTVTALPHIDGLLPPSALSGDEVTINGCNFGDSQGQSAVAFNGIPSAGIESWSNNQIVCLVPSGSTTGNLLVNVSGVNSNPALFTLAASRYYVNVSTGSDTNDGTLAHPFKTILKALKVAVAGDNIRVAAGTYTWSTGETFPLVMKSGVKLDGAYSSDFSQCDPAGFQTILDATRGARVMNVVTCESGTEISGITYTHGWTPDAWGWHGGGVYCTNSSPLFSYCTFIDNYSGYHGGGAYCDGLCNPVFSHCLFTNNRVSSRGDFESNGAGLYIGVSAAGQPQVIDCTFSQNGAPDTDWGGGLYYNGSGLISGCYFDHNYAYRGGGLDVTGFGHPQISNCTFSQNHSYATPNWGQAGGGGFCIWDYNSATVFDCTFSQNFSNHRGGGLYIASNASPAISHCTFTQNSAYQGGGLGFDNSSSAAVCRECTFTGNTATEWGGGAVVMTACASQLVNCLITGNSCPGGNGGESMGGGVFCPWGGNARITGCTITNNTSNVGGGMAFRWTVSGTVDSCTITQNHANSHAGIYCQETASPSFRNCLISGNIANGGSGGVGSYNSSSPTYTNCLITGNVATTGQAGGVYNHADSYPRFYNCTISRNTANNSYGGAIYNEGNCYVTLKNCLITDNSSLHYGGIFHNPGISYKNVIQYCDFYNNGDNQFYNNGATPNVSGDFSLFDSAHWGWDGTGCLAINPYYLDPDNGDFRLLSGSAAINSGDPAYPVGYPTSLNLLDGNWETQPGIADHGTIDMGYHYPYLAGAYADISPACGYWEDSVTLSGTGFGGDEGLVALNGLSAEVSSWSDTQVVFIVPADATSGLVVLTYGGEDHTLAFFTVLSPKITSLNPAAGFSWDEITVNGTGFGGGGVLQFGEEIAEVSSWADNQIVATVPDLSPGTATAVKVFRNNGQESNSVSYYLIPYISRTSSTQGQPDHPLTIYGAFGTVPGSVYFDTTQATVNSWSSTAIICLIPEGILGDVKIKVVADGKESNLCDFRISIHPEGMIGYWKFDEGTGNIAHDEIAGNDGTLINGTAWTTGQVGGALSFDGVDDYWETQSNIGVSGNPTINISFWFRPANVSNNCMIVNLGSHTGGGQLFAIMQMSGHLFLGGYAQDTAGTTNLQNNVWYYVSLNYDGAAHLYLNGQLEPFSSDGFRNLSVINLPLRLATTYPYSIYPKYSGLIDEVAVYNRTLRVEEIQQQYQNGLAGYGY